MADSDIKGFAAQTTALATDLLYLVDPTEGTPVDENKNVTLAVLATYVNGVRATPVNSDSNLYIQYESAPDVWAITRIADGLEADISNNPTMTTTALAWTNRATLTYA